MRGLKALLRVQLLGAFGINRLIKAGTKQEKRRAILMGIAILLVSLIVAAYVLATAVGMGALGMARLTPVAMMTVCALVTALVTIVKANGTLFGFADYDMVMSLPVRPATVIASRLLTMYALNALITLAVMLPGIAVLALAEPVGAGPIALLLLCIPLVPLLPMAVGSALGALIAAISARVRQSGLAAVGLSLAAALGVVALMAGAFSMRDADPSALYELAQGALTSLGSAYPPALLVGRMIQGDALALLWLALLSLLPFAAFVAVLARCYARINSALFSRRTRGGYRVGVLKGSTPLRALVRKEFRRLTSSSVYLLNTCIGLAMMVAAGAATLFLGAAPLEQLAETPGLSGYVGVAAPLIPGFCVAIASTTSVSLNMEGKARWIALSLPVSAADLFAAKILVNLALSLPCVALAGVLFAIGLKTDFAQTAMLFIVPGSLSVLASVAGMAANVKFPRYDWTSEQQAVKQSMSLLAAMGIGFGALALLGTASFLFAGQSALAQLIVSSLLLGIAALIYRWLAGVRLSL